VWSSLSWKGSSSADIEGNERSLEHRIVPGAGNLGRIAVAIYRSGRHRPECLKGSVQHNSEFRLTAISPKCPSSMFVLLGPTISRKGDVMSRYMNWMKRKIR
jgi:hypothetical protein